MRTALSAPQAEGSRAAATEAGRRAEGGVIETAATGATPMHPDPAHAERSSARIHALIITALEGIETTAAALAAHLQWTVEIASGRAAAMRLLQRRAYAVVVLDQTLAEADAEGAGLIWKYAGLAIPLQINFALAGSARLERDLRAALERRQREQQLAAMAATAEVDGELKDAVTGLLLESRLALAEQDLPPAVESRLRTLAGIAERMRARLERTGIAAGSGTAIGGSANTQVPLRPSPK